MRGEDRAEIALSAGGIPGRLIGDFCVPGRPPTPEDRLWLDGSTIPVLEGWSLTLPGHRPDRSDPQAGYQPSYSDTLAHFAACLRTGASFETAAADGVRLLDLVDAVYTR